MQIAWFPPGAPGLRGEALGALERRRRWADVDPLDAGRDVVEDGGFPEGGDQAAIGSGPLVSRDMEPPRVASHVRDDRVEIGRFRLISHRTDRIDRLCTGRPT